MATLPLSLFVTCSSARQRMPLGSQNIRSWWHGEGDGRSTFGRFASHTAKLVRHVSFHVTIQAQLTLYLEARALREGSMIPPRRRRTRWRVDSFWMSVNDADVSTAITSASKPIIPFFPRLSYNIHGSSNASHTWPSAFLFDALHAASAYPPSRLPFQCRVIPTVVRKGPAVLELLSGEDQSLLVRGDTLLVLDLGLDIVDGVGGLDLEGDGLSGKTANNPSEQILQ